MSGPVSPARAAAFDILQRVEEDGAYASVLLSADDLPLGPQDRSLAYELVLGTLRRQLWLDTAIAHFAGRPTSKIDPPVLRALRIGLLQLRFLDRIPPSAAVNESVNLVHRARLKSAAGLTNAVLRRALREPSYDPAAGIDDPIEQLAVETSHPAWLLRRWLDSFGAERTRDLALANNENPVTAFRFTNRAVDRAAILADLRDEGAELTPSALALDAWRISGRGPKLRSYAHQGLIYLQDEASQWVANLTAMNFGPLASAQPILDVCAAPGSKASMLAERLSPEGIVIAGDLHQHRLRTVRETADRTGLNNLVVVAYDAETALPFADSSFSTVLVDSPCSGTGTLRRNPEIRWRISPPDIDDLSRKQRHILASAAKTLRPGGLLIYSTCSVEAQENEGVVQSFLGESGDFRGADLRKIATGMAILPALEVDRPYQARFWPQDHGTEGFFVAALSRISN